MSRNGDVGRRVAVVLIVAPDPNIAPLVGELVAFAGDETRTRPVLTSSVASEPGLGDRGYRAA